MSCQAFVQQAIADHAWAERGPSTNPDPQQAAARYSAGWDDFLARRVNPDWTLDRDYAAGWRNARIVGNGTRQPRGADDCDPLMDSDFFPGPHHPPGSTLFSDIDDDYLDRYLPDGTDKEEENNATK